MYLIIPSIMALHFQRKVKRTNSVAINVSDAVFPRVSIKASIPGFYLIYAGFI